MKVTLLSAAIAAAMLTAGMAQASPDLAKSAGCAKCHEMDKTKKGVPGFKETAAQYKGKADAEATILKKINDPKGDHPEMKAKPEEIQSVVKWILSL
ncbi:MAG: c-type cytochrome [Betaproteobacteria bacterium]|nr:c-type cytochrome [Betaproteobacteria bacterium]